MTYLSIPVFVILGFIGGFIGGFLFTKALAECAADVRKEDLETA